MNAGTPNIFLIGPMGSGKTAVGRYLSKMLRLTFIDSDAEIEKRTGVDIPFIFEKEGEAGFRARESEVLDELTQMPGVVLATGGGAIIRPENRRWLSGRGTVVYLRTSVEQQLRRTRHGHHRPLLNHPDPEGRLRELMGQRAALYEEIAAVTVNTDERKAQAVAQEIQRAIRTIASTGSARP